MDTNQIDALYCVLGELYFEHRALQRRAILAQDEVAQLRLQHEQQIKIKDSQIEELLHTKL